MEPEGSLPCSQEPATCPAPPKVKILKALIDDLLGGGGLYGRVNPCMRAQRF
jgi:hypothetical protein